MEDLGALNFFTHPLSAHPYQADIDSLLRLSNCGNVIVCPNPTSAMGMMHTMKGALKKGSRGMVMYLKDNPKIQFGLACTSGPLGGDAQIAALMCMEDLGALIFFTDPLSAHPHQADIDSLLRLSNCGNVIVCPNPTSAMGMMHTLKGVLEIGIRGMVMYSYVQYSQ